MVEGVASSNRIVVLAPADIMLARVMLVDAVLLLA
jgi:hypothetical protein